MRQTRPTVRAVTRRAALLRLGTLPLLLAGCGAVAPALPEAQLTVSEALAGTGDARFAKVLAPREFRFPADHGPHPEFAAEWWYYTGNLASSNGDRYGFQLTFFRFGLTPEALQRASTLAPQGIAMAHFAVSDVVQRRFVATERFSRIAGGLADAQAAPFRVWLDDWQASGPQDTFPMRLQAQQDDVAIDLTLAAGKPIVLQGDRGLSQKSAEPGNASYYYSLTRMPAAGTIRSGGRDVQVSGDAWMDREWSTSALGENQVGWDWFALHLDDGRDIMFYQLRLRDGTTDPYSKGVLVATDGSTQPLLADEVKLTPERRWRSPRSGAEYPIGWRLAAPAHGLDLRIDAQIDDQELPVTIIYWEGTVRVSGSAGGYGYLEMTGYTESGVGRAPR